VLRYGKPSCKIKQPLLTTTTKANSHGMSDGRLGGEEGGG